MSKKTLILIIFIFIQTCIFGQNTIQDAIQYKKLAKQNFENSRYDLAVKNINKALKIKSLNTNPKIEAECFLLAGNIYSMGNENNYALKYYLRAEESYKKTDDKEKLSAIYTQIAFIYFKINAYEKAGEYFKQAIEIKLITQNKTENYELLHYAGNSYFNIQKYDTALIYYTEMRKVSEIIKDTSKIIKSIEKIIFVNKKQANYKEAITNNILINNLYRKQKNKKGIALTLNNIGYNYVLLKKYDEAIKSFKESLIYQKEINAEQEIIAITNTNIGICYQNIGDFENSIKYLLISEENWTYEDNIEEKAKISNLIALVYYQNGDLHNAALYSEESIAYAEESNNKAVLQNCYHTYSQILQSGNDYENALEYYKKYLKIRDSLFLENKINEQELTRKINELEKSEEELKLKLAEEEIQNMLLEQYRLENEQKEKENELLRRDQELQKAELLQQKYALIMEQQKNQAIKKQKEIEALESDKKIRDLELQQKEADAEKKQKEIALLESEKEKQQLELDKNKAVRQFMNFIFVLFGIILILIIIFLIISVRVNKRLNTHRKHILKQNNKLNNQKEELKSQAEELRVVNEDISKHKNVLEQRHRQITDSITYASRIQNAMLSESIILANYFPNHFIINKPRDIVSGDFYWIKEIEENDNLIVVASDCTGHGVPGAFVSMLGMSLLNEIINKNHNLKANEILDQLRAEIKKSLKQSDNDNSSKDGMDIAICVVDKKTNILQYSGAHNPLYIIRNKEITLTEEEQKTIKKKKIREFDFEIYDNKLTEIKADHQPIGIYIKERPFVNIELKIYKNDRFYIFTDGFIDQFGGENNEKYKSKTFKKKLLEIQNMSMQKQMQELENEFTEWTTTKHKKHEQLDDILIIGIEV